VASSPYFAMKCIPTGRPSAFHSSGTDMAGWPVALNTGVQGMKLNAVSAACAIMPDSLRTEPARSRPSTSSAMRSLAGKR
jgi:hypothetical protein